MFQRITVGVTGGLWDRSNRVADSRLCDCVGQRQSRVFPFIPGIFDMLNQLYRFLGQEN